jgi:hypothetical protein
VGKYAQDIADAKAAIAEAGQLVTWRQLNEVMPDANKPWIRTPGVPTDFPVTIAFLKVKRIRYESQRDMPETRDKIGAFRGLMAGGQPFTPSAKDVVVRNGKVLQIESLDSLAPDGDAIIHEIIFKG